MLRLMTAVVLTATLTFGAAPLLAQQAEAPAAPRFEVVSIKPVAMDVETFSRMMALAGPCGLPGIERLGSLVRIQFSFLCGLVRLAYNVADYQVAGIPMELGKADVANAFQVEARAETVTATEDIRQLLRQMLAERFQLRVHREPREMPIYAMIPAKDGPRFTACSNPGAGSFYTPGTLVSCTPPMPMSRIAQMLTREAGRPVIDKTGLAGGQAFELHWLPEGAQPQLDSPPSLFTAIQEQLGLKLDPQSGAVDSIVIDHAERPSAN
jgi:uncharacterized protein (TIGR03435 family)